MGDEIGVKCPYCEQSIDFKIYDLHLMDERKKIANLELQQCKYSPKHLIPIQEIPYHEDICPYKDLYDTIQAKMRIAKEKIEEKAQAVGSNVTAEEDLP